MKKHLSVCLVMVLPCLVCFAQDKTDSVIKAALFVQTDVANKINKDVTSLSGNIEKSSLRILQKLQKQENKLKQKLLTKDSAAAANLFPSSSLSSLPALQKGNEVYQQLANTLTNPIEYKKLTEYIPQFDSLQTSFTFLNQPDIISAKLPAGFANKIKTVNANIQGLETKLQQANEIKAYIKQRRETLKTELAKFGMLKDMKKLNKQAYYYQQQLQEYKAILKDPKKAEQRLVSELTKLPAFTSFMKKNSQLAQLFRLPDNYGTTESLAGLQTRASVQAQLQQRFGATASFSPSSVGAGGSNYLQQQMQQAQGELGKLKDKINKAGGGSSDDLTPTLSKGEGGFKPNGQKTKSFLQRIEYGANVQSQKTNAWLPVTSDLALTAGYKLNDKSIIGIGVSYKLGWGSGWKHIKLTNEGIGLRSYIDWKLKPIFGKIEGFWISGGYEQNYQHSYKQFSQLPSPRAEGSGVRLWQTSGLIGLSKKYKIGKKTNNLQLLWDFMSYQQVPRRQPILFRVGYVF